MNALVSNQENFILNAERDAHSHSVSIFQVTAYISNFWQNVLILDDFEPEPGICIYITYYCTIIHMVLFTKQNLQNKEVTLSHSGCHTKRKLILYHHMMYYVTYKVVSYLFPPFSNLIKIQCVLWSHWFHWLKSLWSHWFLDKQRWVLRITQILCNLLGPEWLNQTSSTFAVSISVHLSSKS